MLHCILGFLPFVLGLAGIFLGLALNCLGLVLRLLAQTHDGLLSVLRHQRCHIRTALPDELPERGAPMASGSHRMKLKPSSYHVVSSSRISGIGPAQEGSGPWHGFCRVAQCPAGAGLSAERAARSAAAVMLRSIPPNTTPWNGDMDLQ
jgi:hypothetical protein